MRATARFNQGFDSSQTNTAFIKATFEIGLQFSGSCFHRNLLRRRSDIITTWAILIQFLAIRIPGMRVHVIILQKIICFQRYYGALFRLFFLQSHGGIKTAFFSFGPLRNLDDKFVWNELNSNFVHWMNRKDEELSIFKIQEELL